MPRRVSAHGRAHSKRARSDGHVGEGRGFCRGQRRPRWRHACDDATIRSGAPARIEPSLSDRVASRALASRHTGSPKGSARARCSIRTRSTSSTGPHAAGCCCIATSRRTRSRQISGSWCGSADRQSRARRPAPRATRMRRIARRRFPSPAHGRPQQPRSLRVSHRSANPRVAFHRSAAPSCPVGFRQWAEQN